MKYSYGDIELLGHHENSFTKYSKDFNNKKTVMIIIHSSGA